MLSFRRFLLEYNPYHEPQGKEGVGQRIGGRFAHKATGRKWTFTGGPSGQSWQDVANAVVSQWRRNNPRIQAKTIQLRRTIDTAMREAEKYQDYRDWYAAHIPLALELFGENEPLFEKFLAAGSVNAAGADNVKKAIHAMMHYLSGGRFDTESDYPGVVPAMRNQFLHIQHHEELTGRKVVPFYKTLMGDWEQVPSDRHMKRLLFMHPIVMGGNRAQAELTQEIVSAMAKKMGWKPAELQAALWCVQLGRSKRSVYDFSQYLEDQEANIRALLATLQHKITEAEEGDRVILFLQRLANTYSIARLLLDLEDI